tara:strand:- start:584 stop:865 length:282 start_codon:yes stop_codon:yes gene_type:complete
MYPCKTPCGDIDCLNSCIHSKKGIKKMVNTCTKNEVLEHFDLWLWERYDWMGFEQLNKILIKAGTILDDADDLDYYADAGHRVLFDAITGGYK